MKVILSVLDEGYSDRRLMKSSSGDAQNNLHQATLRITFIRHAPNNLHQVTLRITFIRRRSE
jgi:hypothetical protein